MKFIAPDQIRIINFLIPVGNEKSRYYVSGGYLHNKGIVRPASYDRYTLRLNLG